MENPRWKNGFRLTVLSQAGTLKIIMQLSCFIKEKIKI